MNTLGILRPLRSRSGRCHTDARHLNLSIPLTSSNHDRTDTDVRTSAGDAFPLLIQGCWASFASSPPSSVWQYVSDEGQFLNLPGEPQMFVTHVDPIPSYHKGNVIGFATHVAHEEIGILPIHYTHFAGP